MLLPGQAYLLAVTGRRPPRGSPHQSTFEAIVRWLPLPWFAITIVLNVSELEHITSSRPESIRIPSMPFAVPTGHSSKRFGFLVTAYAVSSISCFSAWVFPTVRVIYLVQVPQQAARTRLDWGERLYVLSVLGSFVWPITLLTQRPTMDRLGLVLFWITILMHLVPVLYIASILLYCLRGLPDYRPVRGVCRFPKKSYWNHRHTAAKSSNIALETDLDLIESNAEEIQRLRNESHSAGSSIRMTELITSKRVGVEQSSSGPTDVVASSSRHTEATTEGMTTNRPMGSGNILPMTSIAQQSRQINEHADHVGSEQGGKEEVRFTAPISHLISGVVCVWRSSSLTSRSVIQSHYFAKNSVYLEYA